MRWIMAFIFGTIAVIPIAYFAYLYSDFYQENQLYEATIQYSSVKESPVEVGSEFSIKSCRVIDGFRFSILLENDRWINAQLNVATKVDATKKVVEILELSSVPIVILKRKIDDYWIVDIRLTLDSKVVMLGNLLRELNLVI